VHVCSFAFVWVQVHKYEIMVTIVIVIVIVIVWKVGRAATRREIKKVSNSSCTVLLLTSCPSTLHWPAYHPAVQHPFTLTSTLVTPPPPPTSPPTYVKLHMHTHCTHAYANTSHMHAYTHAHANTAHMQTLHTCTHARTLAIRTRNQMQYSFHHYCTYV